MKPLERLSVVIPARDEQDCVGVTVGALHDELARHGIPHEIVVVDDGSTDGTWRVLEDLAARIPAVKPVRSPGPHGFGRAVTLGFDYASGDAVIVTMADASDHCADAVRYWRELQNGWDAVFGSRFIRGGSVSGYPPHKLLLNRLANLFLRVLFGVPFNDFTNAFKAYRRSTLEGCRPFLAPHFNLTIELPLKTIVRGYSWTAIPVSWRNRSAGQSKLKIKEMGSRYLFIALYCWLEKYFSRGDYRAR
ncbi:MAG: glycosyltransferase family 2 protein [Bryobacterales bacterium]|nr:glycosyltransferase family 2 protein [Bryobacterales bacterium]